MRKFPPFSHLSFSRAHILTFKLRLWLVALTGLFIPPLLSCSPSTTCSCCCCEDCTPFSLLQGSRIPVFEKLPTVGSTVLDINEWHELTWFRLPYLKCILCLFLLKYDHTSASLLPPHLLCALVVSLNVNSFTATRGMYLVAIYNTTHGHVISLL